jgi:hypothetical protein
MSRNGSGVYSLPAGNPVVPSTTISTTWANTTLTDIASALTGSVASDGQTPMSSSLNMNTNQIKNVVDPTLAQDAATKAYVDSTATTNLALTLLKASNLSDVANATTSRTNLSAAKSGANSDITSITGLTTPLTVAQGGIGAATLTANNVLLGNGTSAPQVVAPSTSGNILTSNGTTWTSAVPASYPLTSGTAVASTSGTSIDFTSIPSWVKRITVMFNGVSTNGTSQYLIQLGSGSVTTTGYASTGTAIQGATAGANGSTIGFQLGNTDGAAAWVKRGSAVFQTLGSNIWVGSSSLSITGAAADRAEFSAGNVTLSGTLDRVRITTVNGTDTFDAGSINILYE